MTDKERKLIASTPITLDCFEMDDYEEVSVNYTVFDNATGNVTKMDTTGYWNGIIHTLELLRQKYNETKDKRYWKELIRLLPNSYKVVQLC